MPLDKRLLVVNGFLNPSTIQMAQLEHCKAWLLAKGCAQQEGTN